MKLSQRLWDDYKDQELIDLTMDLIRKYPESCDDVWLTTAVGYPSKEKHKKHAEMLIAAAKMYRENGVSVSLQVANTIGHGAYMCAYPCEGLVHEGTQVRPFVGSNGESSMYSYCPRDRVFRDYINETLLYYADVRPDCLWFDDDFRLTNHSPSDEGCFCDVCIADFNARYGTSFTRESLVEEMLHGDKIWRERYLSFQREGMAEMMEESMRLFVEKSPNTVGGLQHAIPEPFVMDDHNYAFDPMYRVTGKAPWSRPGGGAYSDHNPHRFIQKGIHVAFQNARLPQYVTEISPEIENIPHYAFGKTAAGMALETSYYFAVGATSMSYSMLKSTTAEPIEHYEKFMKLLAEQRPYWEKLSAANRVTRPAGLACFVSRKRALRDLAPNEGMSALASDDMYHLDAFPRVGIPIIYDDKAANVYVLHPEQAKQMSDEDVAYLLTQRVSTDGETVLELMRRGVDIGVKATLLDAFATLPLYERYTDHPLNRGEAYWKNSFFAKGRKACCYLEVTSGKVEILGVYTCDREISPYTGDKNAPFGIAELILSTKEGGKWHINGYQPFKGIISRARRDYFLRVMDYIGKEKIPARSLGAHQLLLHERVDTEGKLVCVSVTNAEIGKCEDARLKIHNPKGERFVFVSQYLPTQELTARLEGDDYIVEIPTMDAWTQGTVFCE